MRNDGVSGPTTFLTANYSRVLTSALIQGLQRLSDEQGNTLVTDILFNDPNIAGIRHEREVRDRNGRRVQRVHDNHLHVTFRNAIGCP